MSAVSLTQAVTSGDAGAVRVLLANGANANERTSGGQTPLILATIFGHTDLIPLLLDAGADPELRDNLGLNALDWAQRRGATDVTALFNGKTVPVAPVETEILNRPPVPRTREQRGEAKPVSEGEKSRRWLAGLKQRIAEQSQPEVPDGSNIFRAQPEPRPATSVEAAKIPPASEPEPRRAGIETLPPHVQETKTLPIANTEENPPSKKKTRKRCPKCGEIYNSDLLAYCAHHVVELVDADAPIISEPLKSSSPVMIWMVILITLIGAIVGGSLLTNYLFGKNRPGVQPGSSSAAAKSVQKGIPLVDPALEGKAVSLPIAECPLNGQEAIPGTVVVRVVINKDGQVTSARASGGDWLLRGAATSAATKSSFSPEKLHGRESEGTITYTFEP